MMNQQDKRITEQSSLYDHLEQMSVAELTANINAENKKVALAVEEALPTINRLISAIEQKVKDGGRLFYAGCGTGGRLATLDTHGNTQATIGRSEHVSSMSHATACKPTEEKYSTHNLMKKCSVHYY